MSEPIEISRHGRIVHMRLSRPEKRNALTGQMYRTMTQTMQEADAAGDVSALIFSGAGGVFTAGNDILDFVQNTRDHEKPAATGFIEQLAICQTPMIAAIDGLAIGVGTTMILHCDFAYATPASQFKMPFVDLGLVPEAASSKLVPERLGWKKAAELLMLGDGFDAREAERLGFINGVVAQADLLAHAFGIAERLGAKPRAALAATRQLMRAGASETRAVMARESAVFGERLASAETQRIFAAFLGRSKA